MENERLKNFYVRTTRQFRSAMQGLLADLNGSKAFGQRKGDLTQENFVVASWLWMREQDVEKLAASLLPYIEQVEATVADTPEKKGKSKKKSVDIRASNEGGVADEGATKPMKPKQGRRNLG